MWGLALLGGGLLYLATKKPDAAPKVVVLQVGKTYRLRLKVVRASGPITRELVDGIKQGLEFAGMRDVRVTYGPQPTAEYTQLTLVETPIEVGKEIELALGGVSATIVFLFAREIVSPGV